MLIGFSSGRYRNEEYFLEKLQKLINIGTNAIEIHPRIDSPSDFDLTKKCIDFINKNFEYISFHAPASDFVFDNSSVSRRIYKKIDKLVRELEIKNVIIHPDIVKDFNIINNKKWPISFENMDARKKDGRFVNELVRYFKEIPSANLVLDVNHCFTNDHTMDLADSITNKFNSKIVQYHISAYSGAEKIHEPFFISKCDFFLSKIKNKEIPMIIEVFTDSLNNEQLQKEVAYIKNLLVRKRAG